MSYNRARIFLISEIKLVEQWRRRLKHFQFSFFPKSGATEVFEFKDLAILADSQPPETCVIFQWGYEII